MTRLRMALEDDEVRVLRLLDLPRSKSEINEATGLEDERLSTILQKLKRNDLIRLTGGKRWILTKLGEKKLNEAVEEPEPPQKESLTEQFKIHKKQRDLLNRCEEITSTFSWVWEEDLRKDLESMEEDISFIKKHLNEASSMEGLKDLEGLLEDLDRSWDELFIRNEELCLKKEKMERDRKLSRVRESYLTEYSDLPEDYLEEMIERCKKDPEHLEEIYQLIERKDNLEHLLEQAFECGIDPRFIRKVHYLATPEKLDIKYLVRLWEDYKLLASRYGPQEVYYFIKDRGRTILKRREDLWETFHRHMFPQRMPTPVY